MIILVNTVSSQMTNTYEFALATYGETSAAADGAKTAPLGGRNQGSTIDRQRQVISCAAVAAARAIKRRTERERLLARGRCATLIGAFGRG